MSMHHSSIKRSLQLLADWLPAAETWWYEIPGQPGMGCYGTGYNSWGVQTNQKYLAAMAALASLGPHYIDLSPAMTELAGERALAALRFSLWSHVSSPGTCTDGSQWGHTWISSLGVERMMYGVELMDSWLDEDDKLTLKTVLTSEADWVCDHHRRGSHGGVVADVWNHTGKNNPESNLWNGAILWRAAERYPDHPHGDAWREQAHAFLINSISIPADADDPTVVSGKPVQERFVGANFWPSYALDHHGYLNVGYMVICISNAAMLHMDLQARGDQLPESLYQHNRDLWQVIRRHVFADGRLARIGGDSRVRYSYCQEYLLPSLVYAGAHLGDAHAQCLLDAQLTLIEREAATNQDSSFYGSRLAELTELSPYYYTRLESDRACVLGMAATWLHQQGELPAQASAESFEASVSGGWHDAEYGAASHRSPTRFASFAWRAHGYAQGLCLPPADGQFAEWEYSLGGRILYIGDADLIQGGQSGNRRLLDQHTELFDGGFLTWGSMSEGCNLNIPEGWTGTDSATHQLVICALPDNHTMVGLQFCRNADRRLYTREVTGLNLRLPNDLYNGFVRRLTCGQQAHTLHAPAEAEEIDLRSCWACVDERIGVVGIYGADSLTVRRPAERNAGKYKSLYLETLGFPMQIGSLARNPHEVLLDCGWAVLASADTAATEAACQGSEAVKLEGLLRGITIEGRDGKRYRLIANFGDTPVACPPDLTSAGCLAGADPRQLPPGAAALFFA